MLSRRSADELRAIEGRYQAQLLRDKARQIELYGQRYRRRGWVGPGFEIAGEAAFATGRRDLRRAFATQPSG
jgi:hypothetical protein